MGGGMLRVDIDKVNGCIFGTIIFISHYTTAHTWSDPKKKLQSHH